MTSPGTTEVLIVEDHPLFSDGVISLLAQEAPHLHCHGVADARAALVWLEQAGGADLVLVDHHLPGPMDGLALLAWVRQHYPTAGRVLTSGSENARLATRAQRSGAMGYLPKSLPPAAWLDALQTVLRGEPWFPDAEPAGVAGLTPRQTAILERIADGQSTRSIARDLGITERTIKYHMAEVFVRLGVVSRAEAVARASAKGWIDLPERAPASPPPDTR